MSAVRSGVACVHVRLSVHQARLSIGRLALSQGSAAQRADWHHHCTRSTSELALPGERNGRSPQIRCDLDFPHASDRMLQRSHLNESSVNAILLELDRRLRNCMHGAMAGCLFAKLGAVLDLFAMNRKTHCLARKNVREYADLRRQSLAKLVHCVICTVQHTVD